MGGSPLFHFPVKGIFFLSATAFVNMASNNGQAVSLQVASVLNNQRNQQSNQQQQIRIT